MLAFLMCNASKVEDLIKNLGAQEASEGLPISAGLDVEIIESTEAQSFVLKTACSLIWLQCFPNTMCCDAIGCVLNMCILYHRLYGRVFERSGLQIGLCKQEVQEEKLFSLKVI